MPVRDICNRNVVVTGRDTTVSDGATLMRNMHIGDLVVAETDDDNRPIGLVTDRDIVVEVVAAGLDPTSLTVGDIMSDSIESVRGDKDFWDALDHMRQRGIRRQPIVDAQGDLEGILTLDDALGLVGEAIDSLSGLIRNEVEREMSRLD
ncbi:MAG: histidine kinase [Gammaproteobacteria bacterium]|nr:histidine kinase [Gammaproteobacteria bacterium]